MSLQSSSATFVEIGLVNGTVKTGRLAKFSPQEADLAVDFEHIGRALVPAEQTAYIGFLRGQGEKGSPPPDEAVERFKVHVAGGKTFHVEAAVETTKSNLGFRGYPSDPASPYKYIHFYAHGVNAKERDIPLGEMLVASGILEAKSLMRGVDAQVANRSAPLGQILVEQGIDKDAVEQAATLQTRRKVRIGEVLVQAGLATREAVEGALAEQSRRRGKRIGEILVDMGVLREIDITTILGKKFEIPLGDLDQYKINAAASKYLPREIIVKHGILPIDVSESALKIAIADPLAVDAIELARVHAKRRIEEVLVTPSQLRRHVEAYLERTKEEERSENEFGRLLEALARERSGTRESNVEEAAAHLVDHILVDAARRGASDIQFEPNAQDRHVAVRFRIAGEAVDYQSVPAVYATAVLARIKTMAGLGAEVSVIPREGRLTVWHDQRAVQFAVATLPVARHGEDLVLRTFPRPRATPLDDLGLSEQNGVDVRRALRQRRGLLLAVGPTRSANAALLHGMLSFLVGSERGRIVTIEESVDIAQPGLRQIEVRTAAGFSRADALRAVAASAPDVLMVSDVPDRDTATAAVEAALGRLVLVGVRARSGVDALARVLELDVDPFALGDVFVAAAAQRLAPALCTSCRQYLPGTEDDFRVMTRAFDAATLERQFGVTPRGVRVWRASGCDACGGSGYDGRVAFHEVLATSEPIKHAIAQRHPHDALRKHATEHVRMTLLQDGVAKALAGATDLRQAVSLALM